MDIGDLCCEENLALFIVSSSDDELDGLSMAFCMGSSGIERQKVNIIKL